MSEIILPSEDEMNFVACMFMGFTEEEQKESLRLLEEYSRRNNPYLK